MTIHRYQILIDAYVLDLDGIDLILEVEWLETLGVTRIDWKKKTMSFEQAGRTVTHEGYHVTDKGSPALEGVIQRTEEADNESHKSIMSLEQSSAGVGATVPSLTDVDLILKWHAHVF